jgi:hypothetical protein
MGMIAGHNSQNVVRFFTKMEKLKDALSILPEEHYRSAMHQDPSLLCLPPAFPLRSVFALFFVSAAEGLAVAGNPVCPCLPWVTSTLKLMP